MTDIEEKDSAEKSKSVARYSAVALALTLIALGLTAGFLLKRQCVGPGVKEGDQYRKDCYSDIVFLYGKRDKPFNIPGKDVPFADHGLAYRDNNLEYPALTGLIVSASNVFVARNDVTRFLSVNAVWLSLIALAGGGALAAIASKKWRILYLAVSPAMISYAFHNWDLLPVGLIGIAMWAFVRKKDGLAGAMLGLGAASKVFPGLILPVFVLARYRDKKPVARLIGQAALWFAVPNVIVFMYAGKTGWWFPWKFQTERLPNFETLSYFIYYHGSKIFRGLGNAFWFGSDGGVSPYARIFQIGSVLVFGVATLWLLRSEYRRTEPFRPFATAFGVVILFLMTAKVYSPQYAIWLLPFFVVVSVPFWTFIAFAVTDMLVLGLIWAYFTHYSDHTDSSLNLILLEIGVYVRYIALGLLLWQTRKATDAVEGPEPLPSGQARALWDAEPAAGTAYPER